MRVLIVSPFHYPGDGVSTYSSQLSEILKNHGHQTAFFAMQDDRNESDPNSDLFVSNLNFVELNKKKTLASGFRVLSRVIYSREARRKFAVLLSRFQPDMIHLQGFHHFISPSILFEAKKRGIPIILTLHDFKMICPNTSMINDRLGEICEACKPGKYYMPVLKRCKKGSLAASAMASIEAYAHKLMGVRGMISAYISPSEFLRDRFIEHGFPKDNLHHIPNMLSEDRFVEESASGDYILFIGRVDPLKGVRELIEAARQTPEIQVVIAGRVAPSMAHDVPGRLPSNVEYVGLKSGDELRALVANALALAVPSTWYENQPFSILEAFAAGKPVIASDLGGMTELVENHKRGILIKAKDVDQLRNAMLWIWSHRQESLVMGRNALEYVRREHGGDEHYARLMEVYMRVSGFQISEKTEEAQGS